MSSRRSVCLEEMVWPEVESALENGTKTAIVAVGSIEQHGPHLPSNCDKTERCPRRPHDSTRMFWPPHGVSRDNHSPT